LDEQTNKTNRTGRKFFPTPMIITKPFPTQRLVILTALLVAAVMARHAPAASPMLPSGEPDPNCPELRLWLRADSGIKDTQGRSSDDPDFNGMVAAWNDRSPQKFNLAAAPGREPLFVQRQPAVGNRPTVTFSGKQVLTRTNTVLNDRPTSTVIFVVQGQPSHSNCIYSSGKDPNLSERLTLSYSPGPFFYGGHSTGGIEGHFLDTGGRRGYGLDLALPGDGRDGSRFFAMISNGEIDRRSLESHGGMVDLAGRKRALVMATQAPLASDKCSRDFYLGGSETDFFWGQIAETIVFNRGLSSAERLDMLKYLRRRYELDRTEVLLPDTYVVNAEDFDGNWTLDAYRYSHFGHFLGNRYVAAEGNLASEGVKTTINVSRDGTYHVWVRAVENQGGLRTIIQGKELRVTHVRGPGGIAWRDAGQVELQAGPAEILVRGDGPGKKNCYAVLINPTAATLDQVEEIWALAYRLRCSGGESHMTALFDNGLRLEGSLVTGWHSIDLFGKVARSDPKTRSALMCLQFDRRQDESERPPSVSSEALLEFQNGDRLRSAVCGYVPATSQKNQTVPAQLLVRPPVGFFADPKQTIAVEIDWLQRIVFEPSPRDRCCPPKTLICRNGRRVPFRAVRWSADSVSVLTEESLERIPLGDIAELRMPTVDTWNTYYRELSILDPNGTAGIVRVETFEDMILTASTLRSSQLRDGNEAVARVHLLQPVWSRAPIPVSWASMRLLWRAPSLVVPLSRFSPEQVTQRGVLGSSWKWQVDRNVAGGILRSDGMDYLWGFGVHAPNTMVFTLPDCVRAFRARVGIDAVIRNGGCAIAKVHANHSTGTPLYQSKPLVGSATPVSTGEIALPPAAGTARKLVLVTENASEVLGEGDGLDIGNHVDWLEPTLLLDPTLLHAEVAKQLGK